MIGLYFRADRTVFEEVSEPFFDPIYGATQVLARNVNNNELKEIDVKRIEVVSRRMEELGQ